MATDRAQVVGTEYSFVRRRGGAYFVQLHLPEWAEVDNVGLRLRRRRGDESLQASASAVPHSAGVLVTATVDGLAPGTWNIAVASPGARPVRTLGRLVIGDNQPPALLMDPAPSSRTSSGAGASSSVGSRVRRLLTAGGGRARSAAGSARNLLRRAVSRA